MANKRSKNSAEQPIANDRAEQPCQEHLHRTNLVNQALTTLPQTVLNTLLLEVRQLLLNSMPGKLVMIHRILRRITPTPTQLMISVLLGLLHNLMALQSLASCKIAATG